MHLFMRFYLKGLLLMLLVVTMSMASYATPMGPEKQKAHGPPGKQEDIKNFEPVLMQIVQPPVSLEIVIVRWQSEFIIEPSIVLQANSQKLKAINHSLEAATYRVFYGNYKYRNIQRWFSCSSNYSA